MLIFLRDIYDYINIYVCLRSVTREYFGTTTLFDFHPTSVSTSTLLLFADDIKCDHTISAPSDCFFLQYDLDQLPSWCYEWNLHFNEDKCVIMRYTYVPLDKHLSSATTISTATN